MARKRDVGFEELFANNATYKNDPGTPLTADDIGKPVGLTDNKTVGLVAEDRPIEGILKVVEADGYVGVQVDGYAVSVACPAGNAPNIGDKIVSGGSGTVKTPGSAGFARHNVVSRDVSADTVVLKLDG